MLRRRWIRWLLALLAWTAVAVFFASQTYLSYKYSGGQAHLWLVLKMNLIEWYGWGFLAPGIIWLGRRFQLERRHWARILTIHSVAGAGVSLLKWTLDNLLRRYLLGFPSSMYLVYAFHKNLLTYWIIVAATQGYIYYSLYREGELRTAQLSAQLAQAQRQSYFGRPRPMTLTEELAEQYSKKGIKAALDYYDHLKTKYYATGEHDFGEDSLNNFGYEILGKKDSASAIQVFQLNAELYPQSGNAWDSLAEAYMKSGDIKKARENYEKALTLDPKNDNAKEKLKEIKEIKDR